MHAKLRIWLTLSASTLVGAAAWAGAKEMGVLGAPISAAVKDLPASGPALTFVADEGGEGGEGAEGGEGGEGGGGTPASYSLNSTDPNAFLYEAKPQIDAYAAHVYAAYTAAAADARKLEAAVETLLATPTDETLAAARTAWVAARPAYLRTEVFRFYDGPIEEIEGRINAWPLNESFIDYVEGNPGAGLINDTAKPMTLDAITGANQVTDEADVTTGWHAIEFLLWGQDLSAEGPGNRPVSDFVAGQGSNDRRRDYLRLVTQLLVSDLDTLAAAWSPGIPDNYAATFVALPQREALGRIVNGMAVLAGFEFMSERLAVALDSGDQEDEHSCFSDTTHQDFVYDLAGIRDVWSGVDGAPSIAALAAERDAAAAAEVDAALSDAEANIAALGDPWDKVLAQPKGTPERDKAEAAVAALARLGAALKAAGTKLGVLVQIPDA